jgi:hypothetical protein
MNTPNRPTCPSCRIRMRHTRTIPRMSTLPELRCYECRLCRLGLTEECIAVEVSEEAAA